ncbi:MAG: chemotaxis protein CheD [Deltaproteobacteria bacterium]|nr:chemotaxis protein CheD [Deltaproteobacteria bacterium]
MNRSQLPVEANYFLKPGYIFVTKKPTIISTVLGSCVAVFICDRKRKMNGINHYELPYAGKSDPPTARYGNVAIIALIRMMLDEGAKVKHMEAQIFGGAHDRKMISTNIGLENIKMARKVLNKKGVRIVSEDVGGEKGRKIVLDTISSEIAVVKVNRIRRGDWYPFEDRR